MTGLPAFDDDAGDLLAAYPALRQGQERIANNLQAAQQEANEMATIVAEIAAAHERVNTSENKIVNSEAAGGNSRPENCRT
jgi:hypothetical protein